jgi:hypothetical protein
VLVLQIRDQIPQTEGQELLNETEKEELFEKVLKELAAVNGFLFNTTYIKHSKHFKHTESLFFSMYLNCVLA